MKTIAKILNIIFSSIQQQDFNDYKKAIENE